MQCKSFDWLAESKDIKATVKSEQCENYKYLKVFENEAVTMFAVKSRMDMTPKDIRTSFCVSVAYSCADIYD